MAPANTSHDRFLFAVLRPLVHVHRRDTADSASTPASTIAGFAAAIAILGAIILFYATYRGIKWYRARHPQSATSPHSVKSTRFKHDGLPAEITIANSNYEQFSAISPAMSQSKFSHGHSRHDQDAETFSLTHTAGTTLNGAQPSHLDWRPPVLTPWKNEHSLGGSDSASDIEAQRVKVNHVRGPSYPSQAYGQGRRKSGGMFGFMRNAANGFAGGRKKGGKDEDGTYLMVNGSPPVGSPPPQYLTKTASNGNNRGYDGVGAGAGTVTHGTSHSETIGAHIRDLGGAGSPPLPPLPPVTHAPIELARKSVERSATTAALGASNATPTKSIPAPINLLPAPPSTASRPLSRVPTTKSYRLTGSSSVNGHSAVPSPRVSSLFRASSRLSHHHGYTPASPGLPNPPVIPPIPALPAHLFRNLSTGKTSSESTDSMENNPRHDSSLSSSTINGAEAGAIVGPDSSEDPTKGLDGKPLPRTMVVTCTFTPSLSDEMPLQIGETVSMLEEYIDEWCFVQRVRVVVKDNGNRSAGGVVVSVHGMVDAQNTVTVPVAGEGNLGAVPRFCLSEWPLAIPDAKEEQEAMTLGQETPTGLPLFTPLALLPSPPISSTTPTFTPSRMDMARQPLIAQNSSRQQAPRKLEHQNPRSRPLPTPTPKPPVVQEQHLDSKFSSWGSTATQMPAPAQTLSSLGSMQLNNHINNTPSTAPFPSAPRPEPANSSNFPPNNIHPLASSRSSHIHPLSNDSRTPSVSSAATSLTAPVPPPTSPESQSPSLSSPAEEDNIKRVSKPPLAPRHSRFPPSPDEEEPSMQMHQRGHSRSGSKSGENGIPRAAERTVTMPPLPRRPSATDPGTADSPTQTPTQPQHSAPAHATTMMSSSNTGAGGISGEVAAWGAGIFPSRDHSLPNMMMTPSTSTPGGAPSSSGMGTSAGSKTPSTAAPSSAHSSPAGKAAFSKRATSAAQVLRSGSFSGPARVQMGGASGTSFGPRGVAGLEKKTGTGTLNFKSLRTGSSTAGVGPVGR